MITEKTDLLSDVKKFASKFIDTWVYTSKEWCKKESSAPYYLLAGGVVLAAEGELYNIMNGHYKGKANDNVRTRLHKIAEKHGYYIEQGYHWSWHFIEK